MKLRRRYLAEAKSNKTVQKCLVVAIVLKSKLKHSRISNYTLNKLSQAAGISHKTAEKYVQKMQECGFIHFEGTSKNKVLIINSLSSHTSNRNIGIDEIDTSNFFAAYRSLQSFLFLSVQHNKDFIRHLLQARHNPDSSCGFRKIKRQVKNLVEQGKLKSADVHYRETGLSLKRIAEEIGCCIKTAERVVEFAIDKQWVEKQNNFEWIYAPQVNHRQIDGFTFSTKHKLCIVHPNTYSLSASISLALSY